jgi:hypothetical protein
LIFYHYLRRLAKHICICMDNVEGNQMECIRIHGTIVPGHSSIAQMGIPMNMWVIYSLTRFENINC